MHGYFKNTFFNILDALVLLQRLMMHELLSHHLSCPDFDVKYISFLHNYFLPAFNNFAILENCMRKLLNWTDLNASVDV